MYPAPATLGLRRDKPEDTAAYPSALQSQDGKIHVVYTSSRRTVINHAVFDESAIFGAE